MELLASYDDDNTGDNSLSSSPRTSQVNTSTNAASDMLENEWLSFEQMISPGAVGSQEPVKSTDFLVNGVVAYPGMKSCNTLAQKETGRTVSMETHSSVYSDSDRDQNTEKNDGDDAGNGGAPDGEDDDAFFRLRKQVKERDRSSSSEGSGSSGSSSRSSSRSPSPPHLSPVTSIRSHASEPPDLTETDVAEKETVSVPETQETTRVEAEAKAKSRSKSKEIKRSRSRERKRSHREHRSKHERSSRSKHKRSRSRSRDRKRQRSRERHRHRRSRDRRDSKNKERSRERKDSSKEARKSEGKESVKSDSRKSGEKEQKPEEVEHKTEGLDNQSNTKDSAKKSESEVRKSESSENKDTKVSKGDSHRKRSRSRSKERKDRKKDRRRSRSRHRHRSRSKDRKERKRSRSKERKRSRSKDRKKKHRSKSKERRSRSRHRSKDRHSRSRSRERLRSRSPVMGRKLTFKEQMRKDFINASKEIAQENKVATGLDALRKPGEALRPSDLLKGVKLTGGESVTPQMALMQTMAAMHKKAQELTGVEVPKYYNPAAVNPIKYAEQVQKRKLLWSKKPEEKDKTKNEQMETQWKSAFASTDDNKTASKFRKLMGMKEGEGPISIEDLPEEFQKLTEEQKRKQAELFQRLDQEYQFARMTTHTQRGVGLGFATTVIDPNHPQNPP